MTEAELTLAIFMLECVFLFGLTFVVTAGLMWKRRRDDVKLAATIVQQLKAQEVLAVEKLRMAINKSAPGLSFEQTEHSAKKIVAKQQLLMAEFTQLFLNRNKKAMVNLPEKLNSYTLGVLANHKVEPELVTLVPAKETFSATLTDKPKRQRRTKQQLDEMIAD
jgi:hypothetical protein